MINLQSFAFQQDDQSPIAITRLLLSQPYQSTPQLVVSFLTAIAKAAPRHSDQPRGRRFQPGTIPYSLKQG